MFQEWCQKTSLNGIIDLFDSRGNKCKFSTWLIIMICMFGMALYMTILNIITFMNSPTVTNIALVASNNMSMPELLLCYQGGVNVASMKRHGLSEDIIHAFQAGFNNIASNVNYTKTSEEYADFVKSKNLTTETFYMDVAGFKCEDVVEERYLAGDIMRTNQHCTNAVQFVGKAGTPCWIFKDNGEQQWPTPSDGGISLTLKSLKQNYNFSVLGKTRFEVTDSYSLVIENRVSIATDQNVEIPMNYKTNILMALTVSKLLPTPGDKCSVDEMYTTSSVCYQLCLNLRTMKRCNCTYPGMSISSLYPGVPMCNIFEFHANFHTLRSESSWGCTKSCLPLCEEHQYQLTVSYLPIVKTDVREKDSSMLTVTFSHMQYTKIEEVNAFTWDVAVANVGGQSGLWLGCSIVTIIQALYYFCLAYCWPKRLLRFEKSNSASLK